MLTFFIKAIDEWLTIKSMVKVSDLEENEAPGRVEPWGSLRRYFWTRRLSPLQVGRPGLLRSFQFSGIISVYFWSVRPLKAPIYQLFGF